MHSIIAAVAITAAALAGPADPTDWWILTAGTVVCEQAANNRNLPASFGSPATLETATRAAGIFEETEVTRDAQGTILVVAVKARLPHRSSPSIMVYFPSSRACERVRKTDPEVNGSSSRGRAVVPRNSPRRRASSAAPTVSSGLAGAAGRELAHWGIGD